jgi:hypothetical protein
MTAARFLFPHPLLHQTTSKETLKMGVWFSRVRSSLSPFSLSSPLTRCPAPPSPPSTFAVTALSLPPAPRSRLRHSPRLLPRTHRTTTTETATNSPEGTTGERLVHHLWHRAVVALWSAVVLQRRAVVWEWGTAQDREGGAGGSRPGRVSFPFFFFLRYRTQADPPLLRQNHLRSSIHALVVSPKRDERGFVINLPRPPFTSCILTPPSF